MLDLRLKLPLTILYILVTLHGVRLARTSLAISKYGGVIAVNDLLYHAFDTDLLVKALLVDSAVRYFVELVRLGGLVASVELERN